MSNKIISTEEVMKKIKRSDFLLGARMPMGYASGYPILNIKNGYLCMTVPYLRYKVTGVEDRTYVFPIRYTATVELSENRIAGFSDLSLDERFAKLDFDKPIGLFRHESVKHLSKSEYKEKRHELMLEYDKLANALVNGSEYTDADEIKMRDLLKMLVEPSLYPIYKILDKDFYNKYLA